MEQGEQELEGSAFRLALVGSRGLVVAYLWNSAIQSQKRNDFHKMDERVRTVTQLQPHFLTPWVFQSWNIAYNVSVEMQGSGDMYYYIARGIDLLAEGERRQGRTDPDNPQRKIGSPDMRYWIAFTYNNKFGVSDNVEVLRCLFQLSCIPPSERNAEPGGLTNADGSVNLPKFQEFCEKYPHLVRRLRGDDRTRGYDEATRRRADETLKCPRPEDIIRFLRDNKDVPSRYKYATELRDPDKQFPVLPPKFAEGEGEANPEGPTGDDFSAYKAARAWYTYSLVPVPPNPTDAEGHSLPAGSPRPGEYDPVKYRIPRQPMLILFRQGAPRTQTAQAEMEQKEGWFDDEGWRIDNTRDAPKEWWFPDSSGTRPLDVVVGRQRAWSLVEWQKAAELWRNHGDAYGLVVDLARRQRYEAEAAKWQAARRPEPSPEELENPAIRAAFLTAQAPYYYGQNRQLTNFPYFLASANGEQKPTTVAARKMLWQAEQARRLGNKTGPRGAIALYKQGLLMWRDVLLADKEFHRPERSDHTDEETYAFELAYLRLIVQDDDDVRKKANELAGKLNTAFRFLPGGLQSASPLVLKDGEVALKGSLRGGEVGRGGDGPVLLPVCWGDGGGRRSQRQPVDSERHQGLCPPAARRSAEEAAHRAAGRRRSTHTPTNAYSRKTALSPQGIRSQGTEVRHQRTEGERSISSDF